MKPFTRQWFAALGFTVFLFALTVLAVGDLTTYFYVFVLSIVIATVAAFYRLFPGSLFFSISLANFLGIYVSIFVFFKTTNFATVTAWPTVIGFVMPVVGFLVGAIWRRREIRRIVTSERLRDARHLGRVFAWLLPVSGIGAVTFLLPGMGLDAAGYDIAFLASMGAITVVVVLASRDVSSFLLDTGLLFEDFFAGMSSLLVPVSAFFTFYSLIVIVFACIYRIMDRFSGQALFRIAGEVEQISFSDALYFSIVTLSTVGYGDIVPTAHSVKLVVAIQTISGVILLLFGLREIMSYAGVRRPRRD